MAAANAVVRWVLLTGVVAGSPLTAQCPSGISTIFFANGIWTTYQEARTSTYNVLKPAILSRLNQTGNGLNQNCLVFSTAYDSNFVNTSNQVINGTEVLNQILTAIEQRGVDFVSSFWDYVNGIITVVPDWFVQAWETGVSAAVSVFNPDLVTQEAWYTAAGAGNNTAIVVAHSQGNLYLNQGYPVVSLSASLKPIAVASPATHTAKSGSPWFTLGNDIILAVAPGALPSDVSNNPACGSTLSDRFNCHSFDSSYISGNNGQPGPNPTGNVSGPVIADAVISAIPGSSVSAATGPKSVYYLSAAPVAPSEGVGRIILAVQGTNIVNFWRTISPSLDDALAVGSTIRALGIGGVGHEYSLGGVFTGTTYPFPTQIPIEDAVGGATDGTSNYLLSSFTGQTIYRTDANWQNPVALFSPGPSNTYVGIAFDRSTETIWLSGWNNNFVSNFSLTGTLLQSFNVGHEFSAGLAIDPADNTLWLINTTNFVFNVLEQYSKTGTLLQSFALPQVPGLGPFYATSGQFSVGNWASSSLTGSCSLDGQTGALTVPVGSQVTFTANLSGGIGSLNYAWAGAPGVNASSLVVLFPSAGQHSFSVTVSDSEPLPQSVVLLCPQVTVN